MPNKIPNKPRYSIVIPAYNEEAYLGATLSSLAGLKTKLRYEVIVVDNNSDDRTVSIAKKYGAKIVQENSPGVCFARQTGTLAAKGDIVISTDADTTFEPLWLNNIDSAFLANPKLVAVAGPCHYTDGPAWGKAYPYLLFGLIGLINKIFGAVIYVTATNIAFKKSAWSGYDTNLTQGGDELYLLGTLKKRGKIKFLNSNPVNTSGRRLKRGLIYNLFVTFILYYVIEYNLTRIFGRSVLGSAPSIRTNTKIMGGAFVRLFSIIVFFVILVYVKQRI